MNLGEVRKHFIEKTGRYDLGYQQEDGTFTDNGANFYINAGLRLLDSLVDTPKQQRVKVVTLPAEDRRFNLAKLYAIEKLYKVTDYAHVPIHYLPKNEFLNTFPTALVNNSEGSDSKSQALFYTVINSVEDTLSFLENTILLSTSFEEECNLRVDYIERSHLTSDDDVTFYTENYPELAIFAACYQLEAIYRNSEGMKDWLNAMQPMLDGIDYATLKQQEVDEIVMEL